MSNNKQVEKQCTTEADTCKYFVLRLLHAQIGTVLISNY